MLFFRASLPFVSVAPSLKRSIGIRGPCSCADKLTPLHHLCDL
jgi:hypothetical protein